MFGFTILTILLLFGLSLAIVLPRMSEISQNWNMYKDNPFVIFASPLLKPENDKRTRMEFASDTFKEGINSQGSKVFGMFMTPVFEILKMFSNTTNSLLNNLVGIRELLKNFFGGMLRILGPFQRRFELTTAQLRKTFIELNHSISKVGGVATGAVYAGISAVQTMMNMFDLMKNVTIAILVILVAMVFWFWFILWPIIPLILVAIGMLASAGAGGQVSGMASTFGCFEPNTLIKLSDNSNKPIKDLKIGDTLFNNSIVESILYFEDSNQEFYNYKNVIVSGSHIVYESAPIFVCNSEHAKKLEKGPEKFYCLITSNRRIPVVSNNIDLSGNLVEESILFADWEELDESDESSLYEWNKIVFETLNNKPDLYVKPTESIIQSEAALAYETCILTQFGKQKIHTIKPGTFVYDEKNNLTKVVGVVKIDPKSINSFIPLNFSTFSAISNACWIQTKRDILYAQAGMHLETINEIYKPYCESRMIWCCDKYDDQILFGYDNHPWYHLITESGSFVICDNKYIIVRDFTDVGPTEIEKTYEKTLNDVRNFNSRL
jgi:hypothetical protein